MISRETSRRASRWSRVAGLALLLVGGALFGQAANPSVPPPSPIAVLQSAPEFRRGIDWLPANAIPHWVSIYAVGGPGGTEVEVQVLVMDLAVDHGREWPIVPCRGVTLRGSDSGQFYYENPRGWSVFFVRPPGQDGAGAPPCEFAELFVSRYRFFLSVSPTSGSDFTRKPPPIPAVLGG